MKKALKTVAINFMVFCTLIVSLELLCQAVHLIRYGQSLLVTAVAQSAVFEIHPYLVGRPRSGVRVTQDDKTISITPDHTRWTGAEAKDQTLIRVAVLGGSTTFGTGVTDQDSWPALLQADLGAKYAVTNYGVPGYSTAENIVQMALLVPEKRPHYVLFYTGWNDIRNYHEPDLGPDYYSHGLRQYEGLGINVLGQSGEYHVLKNTYATVWLLDALKKRLVKPAESDLQLYAEPDRTVDEIYLRNLKTLRLLANSCHAFAIFVPQVLNYANYDGQPGAYRWTRHMENAAMSKLMGRFNARLNEICDSGERNCAVLGEILAEKWIPEDFVDNGHFSKTGGLKFAAIIARFIRGGAKVIRAAE